MKKQATPKNVDEYLARVPQPARGSLNKVRTAIRAVVPSDATEVISYGNSNVQIRRTFDRLCRIFEALQFISD
jgi:uncharacterized protein YdhG (YjbR/CyaY superfamily)